MKNIFTLLIIASLSAFSINAQVKITRATHGFNADDQHLSQPMQYQAPGEAGTNCTWDFSSLPSIREVNTSVALASDNGKYNIEFDRADGVYYLYHVTDKGVEYSGIRKGDMLTYYSKPIVKTKYPQTYGTFFEGNFEGYTENQGEQTATINGYYSTQVDASGTIILPGNTRFPVIRVKTIKRYTTTTIKTNFSYTLEVEKYLWYAQDIRYPVFVTMETFLYDPVTGERSGVSRESFMNANLDPKKQGNSTTDNSRVATGNKAEISCKVTPNPFVNNVQISYTLSEETLVGIELYNMQGTKLTTLLPRQTQKGEQTMSFDLGRYTPNKGIYFVRITAGNKVHNEKLIKQ